MKLLLCLFWVGTCLHGQTIEIKLVNGRTGHPMTGRCVNVWVGNKRKEAMAIPTDDSGVARLQLTEKDNEVDTHKLWKACGLFGVADPVVKYDDSLRINAGYVLCQAPKRDYSWLAISDFSTKEVLRHGVVTSNTCGKATASPRPGQVMIFVRPLNWWEMMKE